MHGILLILLFKQATNHHICVGPCKISICAIIIWGWPRHRRMAVCCIWSKSCRCKGEETKKKWHNNLWIFIYFSEKGVLCHFHVWLSYLFIHNQSARKSGFPVLYGDGSRPAVLQSASISFPKAVMVMYTGKEKTIEAVSRLRQAFTAVKISYVNLFPWFEKF
jgi:hypothetical protein